MLWIRKVVNFSTGIVVKFSTGIYKYHELEQLLGTIDEDLMLMKMEMAKRKWKKEQRHA